VGDNKKHERTFKKSKGKNPTPNGILKLYGEVQEERTPGKNFKKKKKKGCRSLEPREQGI